MMNIVDALRLEKTRDALHRHLAKTAGRGGGEQPCDLRWRNLLMTTTALTLLIVGCSLCFGITAESDAETWNHPVTYNLGELAGGYSFVDNPERGFGNINLLTGSDERIASHTPEGHYLAGWIDNKEGKTWSTGAEYGLYTDDMVFTAVWATGQSWVYINTWSNDPGLTVSDGKTSTQQTCMWTYGTELTVKATTKEGYTSKIYLNGSDITSKGKFKVGENNKLTSKYVLNDYEVTFDSNLIVKKDGTAISSGDMVAYGKELTVELTSEAVPETGHELRIHWNSTDITTEKKFTVGVTNVLSVNNVPIEYAVTFDEGLTVKKNDGDTISSGDMVAYGTMLTVEAAENTGHIPDISLNGVALTGTTFAVGLRNTLTVTYAPIEYTVKIAVQGEGSVDQDELKIPYGTAASVGGNVLTIGDHIVIATPSDRNHRFTAWSGVPATVTSDVTITASFSQTPTDSKAEDETDADDYYPVVPTSPARTSYDADSTKAIVACAAAAVAAALAAMFLLVDSRKS